MYHKGEEIHVSAAEARAGRRGSSLLKALLIGLAIVVAAMIGFFIFGSETAPSQGGPVQSEATAAP